MAKRTVSNAHKDFKPKKQKAQGTLIVKKGSPFEDGHPVREFRVEDRGGFSVCWCLCDDCRAEEAAEW